MQRTLILTTAILALCQPACAQEPRPADKVVLPAAEKPIALKKGDRIVFFGDSITAGGVGKTGYITAHEGIPERRSTRISSSN